MKLMAEIEDLIEEAKLRTLWWAMLIFIVTYFLSHTSTSMWTNFPVAILLVSALRLLTYKVEFRMKVPSVRQQTYLSHLEKKQLSVNDSRLSYSLPPPKWKRKIDSPVVEAAMHELIDKILRDFVTDLWYSDITPDGEAPELINAIIMDALGEISGRVKEINLVDLLTSDMVDLVGDHIDLFRRNQAAIGVDVMKTLSSDERDERLKHHLLVSGELHPALVSPESEYKVLQRLVSGVLAVVLRSRDSQSPLVRCFAREFVTCLVFQPLLNFAHPMYINQVIECILLAIKDADPASSEAGMLISSSSLEKFHSLNNQATDVTSTKVDDGRERDSNYHENDQEITHPRPADWALMLEVATQRRTEILTPENLENLWAKGRNYRRKEEKIVKARVQKHASKGSKNIVTEPEISDKEVLANRTATLAGEEQEITMGLSPDQIPKDTHFPREFSKWSFKGGSTFQGLHNTDEPTSDVSKSKLKRSSSASDLKIESDSKRMFIEDAGGPIISEFYSPDFGRHAEEHKDNNASKVILRNEGQHAPKLRCRVVGAYFEKIGSTSFAVYSIAVTGAENKIWFVKRRYRNFERLHRHLKEIPNYTLHLPPKRIFSSSTEDSFVHQRCIQLDKYLQDLLSIANVAEQHEVWDFFSASSKNYSFGKSSSVMRTLAVNVDDAVDDIVRQFKGVSDGLMRKVVGSSSASSEVYSSATGRTLSWVPDESSKSVPRQNYMETINSSSDNEEGNKQGADSGTIFAQTERSLSDNELNFKSFASETFQIFEVPSENLSSEVKHEVAAGSRFPSANLATSTRLEDPTWIPPEWTPPNVSVPLLNLVDKVFQLNKRGWLRRQVFWISKQIIQLVMEDAIDDFLLRQIYWLRREDTIAQAIRWIQEMLWPGGKFFTKIGPSQGKPSDFEPDEMRFRRSGQSLGTAASGPGSFEQELEAARRASEIKKLLFDGAPAALVGLIGQKQYKRCASDIYYFTQSTTCVKQLAYVMLELVLVSIFPELRDLLLDLHEKFD